MCSYHSTLFSLNVEETKQADAGDWAAELVSRD